jgi:protein-S-isoprenylcysteine O-methyltransferase
MRRAYKGTMFRILLLALSAVWVGGEYYLRWWRRPPAGTEKRDAGTFTVVNLTIYAAVGLGVWAGQANIGHLRSAALAWLGLVLIAAGIAIRWTAIFTLKRFFTVQVAIHADHELIQRGLYRVLRHPSYSGALLSLVGLGLAMASWVALLLIVVPIGLALLYRIRVEERALSEAFGDRYAEYCRRTKRLVPWIY